jgi:hypothetical protein
MSNRFMALAAVVLALATATAANAGKPPPPSGPTLGATLCKLSDIGAPAATGCEGWYAGNLNGGSPSMKADSAVALDALLGVSTFTGPTLTWLEDITTTGPSVDFATPLYGDTVVSFHVGGAGGTGIGVGYDATAFYEFDAGNLVGGLDTITFNLGGLSNARLYSTGTYVACTVSCGPPPPPPPGVPEPASWALMVLGFGGLGAMLRRERTRSMAVAA